MSLSGAGSDNFRTNTGIGTDCVAGGSLNYASVVNVPIGPAGGTITLNPSVAVLDTATLIDSTSGNQIRDLQVHNTSSGDNETAICGGTLFVHSGLSFTNNTYNVTAGFGTDCSTGIVRHYLVNNSSNHGTFNINMNRG